MFRLLGFDVRVRPGFVIFMVLIVVLYGDGFGLWLAVSLAAFTLLHELGHAVAARRNGAAASISLDFLAGYTSFTPSRPISRPQRALISFAGPGVHIAAGTLALVALGANPFDPDSVGQSASTEAIWWAGPVIGLFNLIPVLPLDGGHLAETGLEAVAGKRAHRLMAIASLVLTASFAVWTAFEPGRRGFTVFVAFLLIAQIQILTSSSADDEPTTAPSRATDRRIAAAADAERSAWRTGRPGMLLPGQELSPWYRAHRARISGRPDEARDIIVSDLAATGPRRWWPPDQAAPDDLRALTDLLPRPVPIGNPASEQVLAEVLLTVGDRTAAAHYAAGSFTRHRSARSALTVARGAAAMGDRDTALQWLHAAASAPGADPGVLAGMIDQAPEFAALRSDPGVRGLRAQLTP
jgi:Zn-dependent protease